MNTKISNIGLVSRSAFRPRVGNLLYKEMQQTYQKKREAYIAADYQESKAYLLVGIATYSILLRNEVITNYVLETIGLIRQDKSLYRHEVKKAVKASEQAVKDYSMMVGTIVHMDDEMLDSLDEMTAQYESNIKNKMLTFFYSMKQELDSSKVENSALYTNIELCTVLLKLALEAQESMEKANLLLRERLINLRYLRLAKLCSNWAKVCDLINGRMVDASVDLNTPRCHQACRELQLAMMDFGMIEDLMDVKK